MKIFSVCKNKIAAFILVMRANYWFDKNELARSLDLLDEAISLNLNWAWVYRFRAEIKERLGQDKAAIEDIKSALAIYPNDAHALVGLGHFMGRQGEYEEAIATLSQAIKLSPKLPAAYLERGGVWRSLGKPERAIEDLNKAFSLGIRDDVLHHLRASCYFDSGRIDDALTDITEAIRINPNHADALVQCGLIWLHKGDLEQALGMVNLGISKKPRWFAESHLGRARVRLARNEIDFAIEDYSLAIEMKPDCSDCYIERAWAFHKKGDTNSAISDIHKAHDILKNKYPMDSSESAADKPEYQRILGALKWVSELQNANLKEAENNALNPSIKPENASRPQEELPPT